MFKKDKFGVLAWLFATVVAVFLFSQAKASQENPVILRIDNPYALGTRILIECNWDNSLHKYMYREYIMVKKNSNQTIKVPKNLRECNIWPKIIW